MLMMALSACRKFVTIDPPKTDLTRATIFTSDATAVAAMMDLYGFSLYPLNYSSGSPNGISLVAGLSADELDNYSPDQQATDFYNNALSPLNLTVLNCIWSACYQQIYRANAILEGVENAPALSPTLTQRLKGEALFFRAFAHFYLVNLFGDVPLILTTDYRQNASIARISTDTIYKQIVSDLKLAEGWLSEDYLENNNTIVTTEKTRLNRFAATAMLARVYLYEKDWANAESAATRVIDQTARYGLPSLDDVFLKNSPEAIWQLSDGLRNTYDAESFFMSASYETPLYAALPVRFVNAFPANDQRKARWIGLLTSSKGSFYYPAKYKTPSALPPVTEYSMVLRLGEQYLIRAEARAQQGRITGANSAASDLFMIRDRAGLTGTTATDKPGMLLAIEAERYFELFTEWGHRWLDLKRTNRADAVLGPLKGTSWQTTDQLYPIPQVQLNNNPAMADAQNPGY